MKKIKYFLAIALAAPIAGMIGSAQAAHGWNDYHWARTSNPMPLKVVISVTNFWQYEFDTSISEWNQSAILNMTVVARNDSKKTRKRCKINSGRLRVCNAAYGNNGWLGLATIGLDSNGHIDQGSAKLNDTYSSYWTDLNE